MALIASRRERRAQCKARKGNWAKEYAIPNPPRTRRNRNGRRAAEAKYRSLCRLSLRALHTGQFAVALGRWVRRFVRNHPSIEVTNG